MATFKGFKIPPGTRCPNKGYLILMGLTGAGKTTTINFLFDGQSTSLMSNDKTESFASSTQQILEYRVKVAIPGVGDCDLRVIDTPGFGDTRDPTPMERDARFMATFDDFLNKHEDLKTCFPTTVLLVAKFNDDRIDGETSHFIQMLKAIDNILTHHRLIDKHQCNLVFVLTHTMSEDNEQLRLDPRPKIQLIEGLVKSFTNLPTPIHVVMAENRPNLYKLPTLNGFHKLPSGSYYPLNLFWKIQYTALKADDTVGEEILSAAFKDPKKLIGMELHNEIKLLPAENNYVTKMLNILREARFNIDKDRYMSKELKKHWEAIDESARQPYVNTLQITQSTFDKLGIFEEVHLPTTRESTLKLLTQLTINPPLIQVLEKLGIVPPEWPNSLGVGCFYNIFTDALVPNSPFDKSQQQCTEIGYKMSKGVRAIKVGETLKINSVFVDKSKYIKERLEQMNVKTEFKLDHFTFETQSGHNIIPTRNANQVEKLSALKEHRLFQVYLKGAKLSTNFKRVIGELPGRFDATDEALRNSWNAFFTANGTHVLNTIYAGGSVEIVAVKQTVNNNNDQPTPTRPEKVVHLISEALNNVGLFKPMNFGVLAEDWQFSVHFYGGDPNLIRPTLATLFTPRGVAFYKAWVESLSNHPVMLTSEIGLENIVYFVENFNIDVSVEMEKAMNRCVSSSRNYKLD